MKYYEKEVLSVPAGISKESVEKCLIYECPDTSAYNYKRSLFITFRDSGGGIMDKLYKVEVIISLNPSKPEDIYNMQISELSKNHKERLNSLLNDSAFRKNDNEIRRYYILSENEQIVLKHKPRPERNNAKFTYYSLADILDQNNKFIKPESHKDA